MLLLCRLGLGAAAQRQPHLQHQSLQIFIVGLLETYGYRGKSCMSKSCGSVTSSDLQQESELHERSSNKKVRIGKLGKQQCAELMSQQGVGICCVICQLCVQRGLPGSMAGTRC
jgi:hypothetical protein